MKCEATDCFDGAMDEQCQHFYQCDYLKLERIIRSNQLTQNQKLELLESNPDFERWYKARLARRNEL